MENRPGRYRPESEQNKPAEQPNPQQERGEGNPSVSPVAEKLDELRKERERLYQSPLGKILSQNVRPTEQPKGIFDCAIPKIVLSPFDIQRKYDHFITKEQAIEEGQPWVERLKTFDRQELERSLESIEKFKREDFPTIRKKYQTPQQAELLDYEMETIREQLRQRDNDSKFNE